jgi:hypothetical protein
VGARAVSGRVIAFDRTRGRGIVQIEGRAVVVDASIVDASHLVSGDDVVVELAALDRIVAVRVVVAATEELAATTRGLFAALLDAQAGASVELVERVASCDDLADFVGAWLDRWSGPVRFWEPDNVAAVVDRRRDDVELGETLELALARGGLDERQTWLLARLELRSQRG